MGMRTVEEYESAAREWRLKQVLYKENFDKCITMAKQEKWRRLIEKAKAQEARSLVCAERLRKTK